MSSTPRKSAELFVEPLEARIAPTGLIALTNPDPNSTIGKSDPRYIDYTTPPSPGKLGFEPGSNYGVAGADIFALKLSGDGTLGLDGLPAGDKLVLFNPVQGFSLANPFIQSANGTVVAFFQDINGDHVVQNNELVGISAGRGAALNVNGTVHGDIVGNLGSNGLVNFGGNLRFKQNIAGINVVGDVTGNILVGGSIDSVNVNGNVGGIFAGTAANGAGFHFGDPGVVSGVVKVHVPPAGIIGASITNVSVVSITNALHAGDGGLHASGGGVLNTNILNDFDGFAITSGNGGFGDGVARGGTGGGVLSLRVNGVNNPDPAAAKALISVTTGHGGDNSAGKGGKGGPIDGVAISYDTFDPTTGTGQQSVDHLNDSVIIHAGDGGAGRRGGTGGAVNNALVVTTTVSNGNPDNAETQILSGGGGASLVSGGGRGGAGGLMSQIFAENLLVPDPFAAVPVVPGAILVQAGGGGPAGAGGDVNAVTLLGTQVTINAGGGTDGAIHGGAGGSVNTVNILNTANLFAANVTINAGSGGVGGGNGGGGGNVTTVRMLDSNLTSLTINGGTHGDGGASANALGGAGGSVTDVLFNDSGAFLAQGSPVLIRTGNGGNGGSGGGSGGTLDTVQITGTDLAYHVTTGKGGDVTGGGAGNAGAGGPITNVGISNQPVAVTNVVMPNGIVVTQTQISNANTATVISGAGGVAAAGLGGAGGDITKLNVATSVNVTPMPNLTPPPGFQPDNYVVASGSGASGGAGDGKGGDITSSAAVSVFGSVNLRAGDAGPAGGTTGNGGSLDGIVTVAFGPISLSAGNGGAGGTGGSVSNTGTNLVPTTITDMFGISTISSTNNHGGLAIKAGDGSTGNGVGGAGGAVTNFSGFVSSGGTTSITAGAGGGGASRLSGPGGGVSQIKLTGVHDNVATGSIVTIDAGNAGASARTKHGAIGGDASQITIYNLDQNTIVHHIAAGDGGDGRVTGGAGGNVSQLHVGEDGQPVDIGYRDGRPFGYDPATQAGGIFAGIGGAGRSNGAPGNVMDVTASAIASIVAGKNGVHLAGTVDMVYLEGLVPARGLGNGSFSNFDLAQASASALPVANVVGSVVDPNAPGASTFKLNVDGLIAALNLTSNRNFVPEALLTLDALNNNQVTVADLQEPNPNPVIIPIG